MAPSRSPGPITLPGAFTTWRPAPAMAWVATSLRPKSTSGRSTGWLNTATSWFPTGWAVLSRALLATCTSRRGSRPTRSCRTWPRSFGAWCTGPVARSRSRRMHPLIRSTSSPLAMSWMANLPTRGLRRRRGTRWPWSHGTTPKTFTARRWSTSRTLPASPATASCKAKSWRWDAPQGARLTAWVSGSCIPSSRNPRSSPSARAWRVPWCVRVTSLRSLIQFEAACALGVESLRQLPARSLWIRTCQRISHGGYRSFCPLGWLRSGW